MTKQEKMQVEVRIVGAVSCSRETMLDWESTKTPTSYTA